MYIYMYISYQRFCIEWHLANFVFNAQAIQAHQTAIKDLNISRSRTIPAGLGDIFQKLWVITASKRSNEMVLYIRNKLKQKSLKKNTNKSSEIFTIEGYRGWLSRPQLGKVTKKKPSTPSGGCYTICCNLWYHVVYCCIMKKPYQHRRSQSTLGCVDCDDQ